MLAVCDQRWGIEEYRSELPAVEEHSDVVYLPQGMTPYDQDPRWGLYRQDGALIEIGAMKRLGSLIGQSRQLDLAGIELSKAPDPAYVYGGVAVTHFGHFICTTLPRLWYLVKQKTDLKILFHSHGDIDHLLSFSFIRDILSTVGIDESNFVVFRHPMLIQRLVIPEASLEEQSTVYSVFKDLGHAVGRNLMSQPADLAPAVSKRPAYISKSKLKSGVHRWHAEYVIEQILEEAGCEVVYPETMPLAAQAHLFASGRTVAGTRSSAFHNSILAPPGGRLICLNHTRPIHTNFTLIDKANGNNADYFYPNDGTIEVDGLRGFHKTILAQADLRKLAKKFSEKIFNG